MAEDHPGASAGLFKTVSRTEGIRPTATGRIGRPCPWPKCRYGTTLTVFSATLLPGSMSVPVPGETDSVNV